VVQAFDLDSHLIPIRPAPDLADAAPTHEHRLIN
jgi:hypothetical protein